MVVLAAFAGLAVTAVAIVIYCIYLIRESGAANEREKQMASRADSARKQTGAALVRPRNRNALSRWLRDGRL